MTVVLAKSARLFDALEERWRGVATQRAVGTAVAALFLGSILVIELNRQGLLAGTIASRLPRTHFRAIVLVFTFLLIVEIIGLVFALAGSVANSVGKQFEVLSLILLREAFLELSTFGEPIDWTLISRSILHMLADIAGALLVFTAVGFYYRVQRHRPITADPVEQESFVATKKLVSLLLFISFIVLGARYFWLRAAVGEAFAFFQAFYVILIFSDILIVLVSLRYSTGYHVVFRNSGFAATTVLIRVALTAPPYVNALLGVGAALFAIGLSLAYNAFAPVLGQAVEGRGP